MYFKCFSLLYFAGTLARACFRPMGFRPWLGISPILGLERCLEVGRCGGGDVISLFCGMGGFLKRRCICDYGLQTRYNASFIDNILMGRSFPLFQPIEFHTNTRPAPANQAAQQSSRQHIAREMHAHIHLRERDGGRPH